MNSWREIGARLPAVTAAAALMVVCAAPLSAAETTSGSSTGMAPETSFVATAEPPETAEQDVVPEPAGTDPSGDEEPAAPESTTPQNLPPSQPRSAAEEEPARASVAAVAPAADPGWYETLTYPLTPALLRAGLGVVLGSNVADGAVVTLVVDGVVVDEQTAANGSVELRLPTNLAVGVHDVEVYEDGVHVTTWGEEIVADQLTFNIDGRWFDRATYARTGQSVVVSGAPASAVGFLGLMTSDGQVDDDHVLPLQFDERGVATVHVPGALLVQFPVGEHVVVSVAYESGPAPVDPVGAATFVITELGLEVPSYSQADLRQGATVSAHGFKPGEQVRYFIDGRTFGPVVAGADTVVTAALPQDLAPGEHTVTFVSETGEVSSTFSVTADASGPATLPPSSTGNDAAAATKATSAGVEHALPATGARAGMGLLVMAGAAVLAGAALVVRRRQV